MRRRRKRWGYDDVGARRRTRGPAAAGSWVLLIWVFSGQQNLSPARLPRAYLQLPTVPLPPSPSFLSPIFFDENSIPRPPEEIHDTIKLKPNHTTEKTPPSIQTHRIQCLIPPSYDRCSQPRTRDSSNCTVSISSLLAVLARDKNDKKSGMDLGCLDSSEMSEICNIQCCFLEATPPLVIPSTTYPAHQSLPQKSPEDFLRAKHTN